MPATELQAVTRLGVVHVAGQRKCLLTVLFGA